jgi:hypothetical protein
MDQANPRLPHIRTPAMIVIELVIAGLVTSIVVMLAAHALT